MIGRREYARRRRLVRPRIAGLECIIDLKLGTFMKIFLCWTMSLFITAAFYMSVRISKKNEILNPYDENKTENLLKSVLKISNKSNDLKYILQWTQTENVPFVYMGEGQEGFITRHCEFTNCFVTSDRNYLGDYTKFDVIAFHGPEVTEMRRIDLPQKRSPHQKFVFVSIESADNYPVCSKHLNGFFNWTWTWLDSESKWGYIATKDSNGNLIGPKIEMHWIKSKDMDPVTEDLKKSLQTKTKAVTWFVSNCKTRRSREDFVMLLYEKLRKYHLKTQVYDECGFFDCSREDEDKCFKLIEKDYYFNFPLEIPISEDYATEDLANEAIPIVYVGANYTRFMPEDIHLNAMNMNSSELAKEIIYELIRDKEKYAELFKWRKYSYYSYQRAEKFEIDDYCSMCALLNDEVQVKKVTIYKNFKEWWSLPHRC